MKESDVNWVESTESNSTKRTWKVTRDIRWFTDSTQPKGCYARSDSLSEDNNNTKTLEYIWVRPLRKLPTTNQDKMSPIFSTRIWKSTPKYSPNLITRPPQRVEDCVKRRWDRGRLATPRVAPWVAPRMAPRTSHVANRSETCVFESCMKT